MESRSLLLTRQNNSMPSNSTAIIIVAIAASAFLIIGIVIWQVLKRRRIGKKGYRVNNSEHLEPISETQRPAGAASRTGNGTSRSAGVDRNTSVRSVMTLPAYNPRPGESEQVLGREGERGGIDTVIQFPDIAEHAEEERREEEMEALYQVRLARRNEIAERDERRRLQREARERGDTVALEELEARPRGSSAASNVNSRQTLESLREEHTRIRDRQRAVSTVSYGELGVARHDGTRIRANSEESERPLLGDAASIGASSRNDRRDRRASSVLSMDSNNSDLPTPGITRSRTNSRTGNSLRRMSGQGDMSSPELVDEGHSLGNNDVPLHSPPDYENVELDDGQEPPPDYSSPIEPRGRPFPPSTGDRRSGRGVGGVPQLPSLRLANLPSIVVDSATPATPTSRHTAESRP